MKFNEWNFSFPESVLETLRALDEIKLPASTVALYEAWNASVPSFELPGIVAAMKEYAAIADQLSDMMSATKLYLGLEDFIDSAQLASLSNAAASILPLIDTSVYSALIDTDGIKSALSSIDWSWLSEVHLEDYAKNTDVPEMPEEEKSEAEICAEIAADISEVIAEPEIMHITSKKKFLEWVKESPDHAMAFLTTLFVLIQTICMVVSTWQTRPAKNSQVYQEPVSSSNVVYNLTVDNTVTIVGDVPYYYEVEFTNPETGEPMVGYVYKGNIAIEEPEEEIGVEEDTWEEGSQVPEVPATTPDISQSQAERTE